jgi:hypothetical protein
MNELEAVRAKVRKLERLTRALAVIVGLSLLPWACGAAKMMTKISAKTVETQFLSIVDEDGNDHLGIVADKKGAILALKDGDGKQRMSISSNDKHPEPAVCFLMMPRA